MIMLNKKMLFIAIGIVILSLILISFRVFNDDKNPSVDGFDKKAIWEIARNEIEKNSSGLKSGYYYSYEIVEELDEGLWYVSVQTESRDPNMAVFGGGYLVTIDGTTREVISVSITM